MLQYVQLILLSWDARFVYVVDDTRIKIKTTQGASQREETHTQAETTSGKLLFPGSHFCIQLIKYV